MKTIEKNAKSMFLALLEGKDSDISEKLEVFVFNSEYLLAHDGGEPDLEHILAVKLLEKMKGRKLGMSMIYQKDYLEHVRKREEG